MDNENNNENKSDKLSLKDLLYKYKKVRDILILVLLIIALVIILLFNSKKTMFSDRKVLMCPHCDETFKLKVKEDLSDAKCPRCKKGLFYTYKCKTCQYEFPYKPKLLSDSLTESQKRLYRISEQKCPNCESVETYCVSVDLYDTELIKHKKARKLEKDRADQK